MSYSNAFPRIYGAKRPNFGLYDITGVSRGFVDEGGKEKREKEKGESEIGIEENQFLPR